MSLYSAFFLGMIQGVTEFLPISSDGHLVLFEKILNVTGDPETLLRFDIVLHAGSFLALTIYFWKTIISIIRAPLRRQAYGGPPLLLLLIGASIPVGIAGVISADWIAENTRTPLFVAFGFIFTGAFLMASSWFEERFASQEHPGWKQAIGAGIGQALAILPGFSRSGLTISSGRLMGLSAHGSAEFAFLLGIPAIAGAALYAIITGGKDILALDPLVMLVGFIACFITSISAIHFLLRTIRRYGVWMWAVYLFIAAALIIADEMLPLVKELSLIANTLDMPVIAGTLFIAILLESVPFTSFFVPGITTLVAVSLYLRGQPLNLLACIPIATAGLVLGHLLGYIPARQARLQVRWKEKTEERLTKAQRIFRKWGIAAVFFGGWWAPIRPWISIAAGLAGMRPLPYMLAMVTGSLVLVSAVVTVTAVTGNAIW